MSASDGRPASLLQELKHRKVYHTTGTYGAAVFVVWQVADIAFPALGLPATFMRFVVIVALLGFPVAIALSWLLEIIPQRSLDGGGIGSRLKVLRPTALALGAVLVVGTLGWTWAPHGSVELAEGEWVIVAGLQDDTGDPVLGRALDEALRMALSQSPRLNVFPETRVRDGLARMRRDADATLDEALALELAIREGVPVVLVPSARRLGGPIQLAVRIVEPGTGETVGSRAVRVSSEGDILGALDELARQVRQALGESLGSLIQHRIHLHRATTTSLDALKAWTEGNRHWDAARLEEAGVLYRRAVELDSTFALAHADVGQWYYWSAGDPLAGRRHFDAALRHSSGLAEHERLAIQGKASEWGGDREAAAAAYAAITAIRPADATAWGNLAYQHLRMRRFDQAIAGYQKVLDLDSLDANAWVNIATAWTGQGDAARAIPFYERAFEIQPALREGPVLNEEYGHTLVAAGRLDEAARTYDLMLDGSTGDRARGLRSLALLRMFEGRYLEAIESLRQAVALQAAADSPVSELRDRCFLAAALLRVGRTAEAVAELDSARALAVGRYMEVGWAGIVGVLAARTGDRGAARELLDTARARSNEGVDDRTSLLHLEGELALAEGDGARALERIGEASALAPDNVRVLYSLARARRASGDLEGAANVLERVVEAGIVKATREAQEEWIVAHHLLGHVLEELDSPDAARAPYERFLEIWGEADASIEEVRQARRRVAALSEEG